MAFKENKAVDKAWEHLYQRLANDGLLPEATIRENSQLGGFQLSKDRSREGGNSVQFSVPRVSRRIRVAAMVAACLFLGWFLTHDLLLTNNHMKELYNETQAATLATVLEDGSVVYLSEHSRLQYPDHFASDKRAVVLQGEAIFNIKKQADYPFIIDTDVAQVEVTGTSFKMKSETSGGFLLSVREGEVRVNLKKINQSQTVGLGETLRFDSEHVYLTKFENGFNEYFQQIRFKDEYLTCVATIINLHAGDIQLYVDPEIDLRITFTYIANSDLTEVTAAICLALNLQHTRQGNTIHITKPK